MRFSLFLKNRLNEIGMNQKQLADCLGMTQNIVSLWTRGENLPRNENVEKLAECLNTPSNYIWELLGREYNIMPPIDLVISIAEEKYGNNRLRKLINQLKLSGVSIDLDNQIITEETVTEEFIRNLEVTVLEIIKKL